MVWQMGDSQADATKQFIANLVHSYFMPIESEGLTLKVLVVTIGVLWEGMGDVGSVRYEPALLPPMPDYKGFKLQ